MQGRVRACPTLNFACLASLRFTLGRAVEFTLGRAVEFTTTPITGDAEQKEDRGPPPCTNRGRWPHFRPL
eukprot:3715685-Pyramimonas_sp.AAC.1